MRPIIIIQARMGSTRLPGKVLAPIEDRTLLDWVFHRCSLSRRAAGFLLATTKLPEDDALKAAADHRNVPVFRGSETDVLARYVGAAVTAGADPLVRITADCPLVDPGIIDEALAIFAATPADYLYIDGYPNGLGAVEVMRLSALRRAHAETDPADIYYREHVMTYLTANPDTFSLRIEHAPTHLTWPELRLCVDEPADLEAVRQVCRHFAPRLDFTVAEIIALLRSRPDITTRNAHVRQKTR